MKTLQISVPVNPMGSVQAKLIEWIYCAELAQMANARGWQIERRIVHDSQVVSARNKLIKHFLDETTCDVLLTIDSDQVPQLGPDDMIAGLDKLLDAIERDDVDVVNALTVRGTLSGPEPVLMKIVGTDRTVMFHEILMKERGLHELKTIEMKDGKPTNVYGAMGGAAIMVKRHVLEGFREKNVLWFWDQFCEEQGVRYDRQAAEQGKKMDLWGRRLIGHDYWFFCKCHELGYRCWVDTSVFWGHIKPMDMRMEWRDKMGLFAQVTELKAENERLQTELSLLKDGVPCAG